MDLDAELIRIKRRIDLLEKARTPIVAPIVASVSADFSPVKSMLDELKAEVEVLRADLAAIKAGPTINAGPGQNPYKAG